MDRQVRGSHSDRSPSPAHEQPTDTATMLDRLQRKAFDYFLHHTNPVNGLVLDKTKPGCPASIAAVGLALTNYPVGIERGFLTREEAIERSLAALRFFGRARQGTDSRATGYRGLFYHFLDFESGERAIQSEISTMDTAILIAGALVAAAYFDRDTEQESELRALAAELERRAEWDWALGGGPALSHGWLPDEGFMPDTWLGYSEALVLYALALGSPTHPIPVEAYRAWCSAFQWIRCYEWEFLYAGPLFIHQLSHLWIDLRGLQDDFMRERHCDYFENSRRATYIHRAYAIENPRGFSGYGENCWGITASDGPGPGWYVSDEKERTYYDYLARGVPYGPDDGTLAPWAVLSSLPFAPEIVIPAVHHFVDELRLEHVESYGFYATFNWTFPEGHDPGRPWVSPFHFGINEGPISAMIENYRGEFVWKLTRRCSSLVEGLRRAGFRGGWL